MKILFIFLTAFLLAYIFSLKEKIYIKYYYNGPCPEQIQQGLNYWQSENLLFEKTNHQEDAYLTILHVEGDQKINSKWVAQYNHRSRSIYINDKFKTIIKDCNLAGVIAHEVGHFIGLNHNSEQNSIMNNASPYNTIPSDLDKKRATNLLPTLFYKKIIDQKIFQT